MKRSKILYVEDEPFLAKIVKDSLESRQYDVSMAMDGDEAIAKFNLESPDLVVLDIMLPNRDGYAVASDIRKLSHKTPIIFLTARGQTHDVVKGFESGGNDYLRKPFSVEELIVRIENLLVLTQRQKEHATGEIVAIGMYQFNPLRYELKIKDRIKRLSHRESTLLQSLINNKNSTVMRKEILMKLWGDDSFFNSRNLDVYITKLRDYLKEDPSVQIITIKGLGYHFTVG
jgi:DNA-binding response OmpR family regulator